MQVEIAYADYHWCIHIYQGQQLLGEYKYPITKGLGSAIQGTFIKHGKTINNEEYRKKYLSNTLMYVERLKLDLSLEQEVINSVLTDIDAYNKQKNDISDTNTGTSSVKEIPKGVYIRRTV